MTVRGLDRQSGFLNRRSQLEQRLRDQGNKIDIHDVQLQIAAVRLADLEQILNQMLQTHGIAFQHRQIFLPLGFVRLLLHQIDIGDQRGQRGFQVVGDVGNQFGFHLLALGFFRDRRVEAIADIIQLAVQRLENP